MRQGATTHRSLAIERHSSGLVRHRHRRRRVVHLVGRSPWLAAVVFDPPRGEDATGGDRHRSLAIERHSSGLVRHRHRRRRVVHLVGRSPWLAAVVFDPPRGEDAPGGDRHRSLAIERHSSGLVRHRHRRRRVVHLVGRSPWLAAVVFDPPRGEDAPGGDRHRSLAIEQHCIWTCSPPAPTAPCGPPGGKEPMAGSRGF